MEKLIHLKNDLGINKVAIWKSYDADGSHLRDVEYNERGFDELKSLLEKRTQKYTKDECRVLVGNYITSHDDCVMDNPDDFTPLEVYQANEKYNRYKSVLNKLNKL